MKDSRICSPRLYYRCSLWLCALYLKTNYPIFFLNCILSLVTKRGRTSTILDFQWLFWTFSHYFLLKLLVKWWKMRLKVIFGQMGTVNHFVNKNGRVAIFITTMADGGHLVFFSTVLIWNGEQCNKKWFSFIQNGLQRPFLWKTFGTMTTKYMTS